MLINEKDLGLSIGTFLKNKTLPNKIKSKHFIIPNFIFKNKLVTVETHLFFVFPLSPWNDSCIDILQEYIFPNFIKWEEISDNNPSNHLSDNYSVWFDVDEEILLYYYLKMENFK